MNYNNISIIKMYNKLIYNIYIFIILHMYYELYYLNIFCILFYYIKKCKNKRCKNIPIIKMSSK